MLTPIATVEERLRIIDECRKSGLTGREWCRQQGLCWNTYHTWVSRLKKKGLLETAATVPTVVVHEPKLPDIVKVEMTGRHELAPVGTTDSDIWQESTETNQSSMNTVMEIEVGRIRIKATNHTDPKLLAEVIRQIGGIREC